jgi:two-component system sensor histidine kinase DesK
MDHGESPYPSSFSLACRLSCEAFLLAFWFTGTGTAGLLLTLALLVLSVARWRFPLPAWTTLADQALCIAVFPTWPSAAFALALPLFDATAAARPWFALPGLAILAFLSRWSLSLASLFAGALLCGAAVAFWSRQAGRLRREADAERGERLVGERLREEMAHDSARAARIAQLSERARIARDLHDHAGHEIIAAQLGLDAFEQLWREGDPQAGELLAQARGRLQEGMGILRATVRGLAPSKGTGVEGLDEICQAFADHPVRLGVTGNTDAVPPYAWAVLEPCLKEGLTNAARHGTSSAIEAALDVGPHIVRLCVASRGAGMKAGEAGFGLRSLQQRARAIGGSVATDARDGFRLICVLPLPDPSRAGVGTVGVSEEAAP